MNITKIMVSSVSRTIPAHKTGKKIPEWAQMTFPEQTARRIIVTKTYDNGTETAWHTNDYSEGRFMYSHSDPNEEIQLAGTMQYSLAGKTADQIMAYFKRVYGREIRNGAEIVFDLDF